MADNKPTTCNTRMEMCRALLTSMRVMTETLDEWALNLGSASEDERHELNDALDEVETALDRLDRAIGKVEFS